CSRGRHIRAGGAIDPHLLPAIVPGAAAATAQCSFLSHWRGGGEGRIPSMQALPSKRSSGTGSACGTGLTRTGQVRGGRRHWIRGISGAAEDNAGNAAACIRASDGTASAGRGGGAAGCAIQADAARRKRNRGSAVRNGLWGNESSL